MNCIILHGCPTDSDDKFYNKHWIPWIKNKLIEKGIKIETPLMPEPWYPNYKKFKKEFEKYDVNENTVLIGHSCGCAFLVRWLGESKKEISKLILVAPWKIPDDDSQAKKDFYDYSIDDTIRNRVEKITMFTSDTEEEDGKKSLRIFQNALGGEVLNLKNHGHYTENDMRSSEFPELLKLICQL